MSPYTLKAVVTETRDGNAFAAFLGKVLGGAKDDITTELTKQATLLIDGRARADAKAADSKAIAEAAVAASNAATTAAEKFNTAIGKLRTCSTSAPGESEAAKIDRLTKASDAQTSQVAANATALAAGMTQPFRELVPVKGTADVRQTCKNILEAAVKG